MASIQENTFDIHLILVGVAEWVAQRQDSNHKLSDLIIWMMNILNRRQIERGEIPTLTHQDTLSYLTRPIEEIFDDIEIPETLDAVRILDNFPVETEFYLADGVSDYLTNTELEHISKIKILIEKETNETARNIKIQLSNQYRTAGLTTEQRRAIEREYVEWRTFFTVENNVVSPTPKQLLDPKWLKIRDQFYEPYQKRLHQIIDRNKKGEEFYHISQHCGLLYRNNSGEFTTITFAPEFTSHANIEQRRVCENDWVLKQTHQRRILIPGIPELRLYHALLEHPAVVEVRLYPGVDRYDMRVMLQNGIGHGIDVKDHHRPDSLEKTLSRRNAHPIIDEHEIEELSYDYFFYLLPASRVKGYPNGLDSLVPLTQRHNNLFVRTIEDYLQELNHV